MMQAIMKSLSRQFVVSTTISMIILHAASHWLMIRQHDDVVESLEQTTNEGFVGFFNNTLAFSFAEGDPGHDKVKQILGNAANIKGIEFIQIAAEDGRVIYSSRAEDVNRDLTDPILLDMLEKGAKAEGGKFMEQVGSKVLNAVPLHNKGLCVSFSCHPKDEEYYLGSILMSLDYSQFNEELASIRYKQLALLIVSVILVQVVIYFSLKFHVLRPVFSVVDSARKMAQGDLSQPILVNGENEMAQLADHINTLRSHLKQSVERSSEVAEALAQAVGDLDLSSENLVTIAMEQSTGAAQQASAVQEATTTAEEIAATSNEISANVESVEQVAEETFKACIDGRESIKGAVGGMGKVKEKVRHIAESMVHLGKKSKKIGGIVDIIDEISEQTHLLALNAAIEAAGAGENGKRFSVVAGEIRRLAERTVEATAQIKGLIDEIQESTNETVLATEKGTAIVMEGADKVDEIGDSLEGILSLVRQTKESSKEITVATQQQARAGEQMVLTITDINDVAVQVNRSAEQVEKAVIRLKDLARRLKDLAAENRLAREFTV